MGIQNLSFVIQTTKTKLITLWDEVERKLGELFVVIAVLAAFVVGLYCGGKVMENTQKLRGGISESVNSE